MCIEVRPTSWFELVSTGFAGDRLALLVDDQYESLFERLCAAATERRPIDESLLLARWLSGKERLYYEHGIVVRFSEKLKKKIKVEYAAAKEWLGAERNDDGDSIGPRDWDDFEPLAQLMGIYRNPADIRATYDAVCKERVNRRRLGRLLHDAISALARTWSIAWKTAEALGTEVEEVTHALKLFTVVKITVLS